MPTIDYTKFVNMATRLLTKFGKQVTITYTTSETYSTTTLTNTKVTSTFTGQAVVVPFNKTEKDQETIQQEVLTLVLNQTSQAPQIDNVVTWEGVDYRVMTVEVVSPGGVDVVYICTLEV